jgi:four helix bundle suffix protein
VAQASLEELLIDYKDFPRTHTLNQWDRNHRIYKRFSEINKTPNATYETYRKAIENEQADICANSMICLINIVSYLLGKQIKAMETAFVQEGGIRLRMTKARIE